MNQERYWIIVASKDHVEVGVREGFAQANHGKKRSLQRMSKGDWVIYYSSKLEFGNPQPCQCFTALGQVADETCYQGSGMSSGYIPWRRNIQYEKSIREVEIKPLLKELDFIRNPDNWGFVFRFGFLEIDREDFFLIRSKMKNK